MQLNMEGIDPDQQQYIDMDGNEEEANGEEEDQMDDQED